MQEETKNKFSWKNILGDLSGWKKDLKKISWVLVVIVLIFGLYQLVTMESWGIRFYTPVEFISYQTHSQSNPELNFSFSKLFVFDDDSQHKYGEDYVAGFHLNADQRTGCDVRKSAVGINFSKNDSEISEAISKDLEAHVRGFAEFSAKRIKIGKENAFKANFSLTDPLSNTLSISQVMVSHGGQNYLLVCGGSQAQRQFYEKDFQHFFDTFSWEK